MGRASRAGADAAREGPSEGKSKGDSAVGPCEGLVEDEYEYSGGASSPLSWASRAARLTCSFFDIGTTCVPCMACMACMTLIVKGGMSGRHARRFVTRRSHMDVGDSAGLRRNAAVRVSYSNAEARYAYRGTVQQPSTVRRP